MTMMPNFESLAILNSCDSGALTDGRTDIAISTRQSRLIPNICTVWGLQVCPFACNAHSDKCKKPCIFSIHDPKIGRNKFSNSKN